MAIRTVLYGVNGKMGQLLSKHISHTDDFEVLFGVDREPDKIKNGFPVYQDPFEYYDNLQENSDDHTGHHCDHHIDPRIDLLIDFSHVSNLDQLLIFAIEKNIPTVIATTGIQEQHVTQMKAASLEIPLLYAPNLSLGVNIMNSILKHYTKIMDEGFDIEIIEKHHSLKRDAPSGTALLLANTINHALGDEMTLVFGRQGSESLRTPNEIGIHSVRGGSISGEHTVLFAGEQEILEIKHTALSKDLFAHDALRISRVFTHKTAGFYTVADLFRL